jgi:outer membrane protein OmpA-like peptidoglycan-associated protein
LKQKQDRTRDREDRQKTEDSNHEGRSGDRNKTGEGDKLKGKQGQEEVPRDAEHGRRDRMEQDRQKAEDLKQKQDRAHEVEDRQKTEDLKRNERAGDHNNAGEGDTSKGNEPGRRDRLEQDRNAEDLKRKDEERERTRAEQQKKNDEDRRNADTVKEQHDEHSKANANRQKETDQDKAKTEKPNTIGEGRERRIENGGEPAEQVRKDHEHADQEYEKAKSEARKEREQGRAGPADEKRSEESEKRFEALRQQRHERVEEGGRRIVIEEPDSRRIIRENGHAFIRHDESDRFQRTYGDVREERHGGLRVSVFVRPGGGRIFTEYDEENRPLRRYRQDAEGREITFFDNRRYYRHARGESFADAVVVLPPPEIRIARERYVVDYERASDDDIYYALSAPPVEHIEPRYSLEEVRYSRDLRDRMPRVDLDTIHFDFGSWEVEPSEYRLLERVARVINRVIEHSPDEMFLIEGHTDAVGSDEDNLSLSDRRAQAVAEVLTREFQVPAENLTTQGYGEQFLKINSPGPERANRRVAVRRITPLLARGEPRD